MTTQTFITRISRALGRPGPAADVPPPPTIEEPIVRLVHSDIGLSELFVRMAQAAAIGAELIEVHALRERLVGFLTDHDIKRAAMARSKLLDRLELRPAIQAGGIQVKTWDELTPDALYDYDCGITDAYAAVAETGSIVVRESAGHGRALSLVPPVHVCIIEPRVLLPDLVDLMARLRLEGCGSGVTLITGPSKTADIECTLVTGVHGPGEVRAFVLK